MPSHVMSLAARQFSLPTGKGKGLDVAYATFLGLIWTFTGLALVVTVCRMFSRLRFSRRLYMDDFMAISATILLLATAILWQVIATDMYYVQDVQVGLAPFRLNFFQRLQSWLKASLAAEIFYYTCLLFTKLSFLFFFRRLGSGVKRLKYIWWPAMVFVIVTYVVSMGDVDYKCLINSDVAAIKKCDSPKRIAAIAITLEVNCVLDVVTDLIIMSIPTVLLWKVRLPLSRKLAIIFLLSLTFVTIVVSIVRTIMVSTAKRQDGEFDVSWLYLWSVIEPSIAIVVCGLSAFPQLFKPTPAQSKPTYQLSQTYLRRLARTRTKSNPKSHDEFDLESSTTEFGATSQDLNFPSKALSPQTSHLAQAYRGPSTRAHSHFSGGIEHNIEYSVSSEYQNQVA